ncbi:MAG: GatB/YqeY domain-containing protein [Clostridiaceae bacterium]|nr:GatB/YqeY domain-containing protein [Clostridiaceae bacterium]
MTLKERLLNDFKIAMRDKDTIRKDTIQLIRAAILKIEKDKHITLDDEGVAEILAKELKSARETLSEIEKSGREDLMEKARKEIEIIQQYLPEQLTEDELEAIIKDAILETGAQSAKDMGKIMKVVMPRVKGRSDGSLVNQIARKLLS